MCFEGLSSGSSIFTAEHPSSNVKTCIVRKLTPILTAFWRTRACLNKNNACKSGCTRRYRLSQNRIESYHQLRAAVAKVGGKKELTGKNDIETDISNQCGRLICNAIVYYNSAILSRLLERLEAEGNDRGIEALTRISPVAWQHILLNGHYTFQSSSEIMDLDTLVAGLKLG